MSRPRPPAPCALAVGVLAAPGVAPGEIHGQLARAYAPVIAAGEPGPFGPGAYYEGEMGPGLRRWFVELDGLWDPGALAALKLRSNGLEAGWSRDGRRGVNLDPGLVGLSQLVLASGKPSATRVYLGERIYAGVELVFEHGSLRPLPRTYPDYQEPAAIAFFNRVRARLRAQLRRRPAADRQGGSTS